MTDEELNELEAMLFAATPGDWFSWEDPKGNQEVDTGMPNIALICRVRSEKAEEGADFIAAAKRAMPSLLAEIRRLRNMGAES